MVFLFALIIIGAESSSAIAIRYLLLIIGGVFILILVAGAILVKYIQAMNEKEAIISREFRNAGAIIKLEDHVRAWVSGALSDNGLRSIVKELELELEGTTLAAMIAAGDSELTEEEIRKLADASLLDVAPPKDSTHPTAEKP